MKYALCFLGLLALVIADKGTTHHEQQVADAVLLKNQKLILQLLWRVNQPVVIKEIIDVAQSYDIQANVDKYTNVEAVKKFVTYYKRGFLPKNEIFSVLYDQQRQEAISLFDVFYYAKDFDTFYKTAAWARVNMNPGQFVYALSVAVLHREDTKHIVLPAPYEIYPHLFVDSYVIQEAVDKRMTVPTTDKKFTIIIPVNKTGMYPYYHYADTVEKHMGYQRNIYGYESLYHTSPEDRVAYFTEDIALNSYYNYFHLYNPSWMNSSYKFDWSGRGEYFYYFHQQLLAKYVLERFSNDLEDVQVLNLDTPIEVGYNPTMHYPNGQDFPIRVDYVDAHKINAYEVQLIQDFERRIRDAIDLGYVVSEHMEKFSLTEAKGIDILGQLIESTANSVHYNYYGRLYQLSLQVLGHIMDPSHVFQSAPGVLEHYETVLRDPLYYRLLSSMVRLFLRHKSLLPRYLREEIMFPGVKIESVDVEKLITYFDTYDFDISAAVKVTKKEEDNMVIKARQYRINHKPFTYTVNLQSEKAADVVVRTFIGPKYDAEGRILSMNERRRLMVEVDRFPQKLTAGKTTFTRNSADFFSYIDDATPIRDFYAQVDDALNGKGQSSYDVVDHQCGFPHRLLLPKGKRGGMPFVFFVAVSPVTQANEHFKVDPETFGCRTNWGLYYRDQWALGWPFDRVIDETQFNVPNFYEKDVIVFHKRAEDINNQSI